MKLFLVVAAATITLLLLPAPAFPDAADDPVRRWWQEHDLRRNLERPLRPPAPLPPEHPCERYARIARNVGLGLGPFSSDDPIITYIIEKRPDSEYIREVCYRHAR